jgi:hypothetical protein
MSAVRAKSSWINRVTTPQHNAQGIASKHERMEKTGMSSLKNTRYEAAQITARQKVRVKQLSLNGRELLVSGVLSSRRISAPRCMSPSFRQNAPILHNMSACKLPLYAYPHQSAVRRVRLAISCDGIYTKAGEKRSFVVSPRHTSFRGSKLLKRQHPNRGKRWTPCDELTSPLHTYCSPCSCQ